MKKVLLGIAAVVVVTSFGVHEAQAISFQGPTEIINALVKKFSLKKTDVEKVFSEVHEQKQKEMEKRMLEKLNEAVKDGKITEAQKKLIIAKHEELEKAHEKDMANWQNLTPEERREKMQKQHEAMQKWASENNIDLRYMFGGMMKGEGKMGRFMMK